MQISDNWQNRSELERYKALAQVAQSQAQRTRIAISNLEISAINDHAFLSLATAIYAAKDCSGVTWGNLAANLNNVCSEVLLRKLASRSKTCSFKTFNSVRTALITLSNKRGFSLPTISDMKEYS